MQSSEPSSPASSIDLTTPLKQEIKDLKAKLSEVNANFTYYEESNERLENQVDEQTSLLERKDAEIARLKAFIATTTTEYEETASENVKLRRQSSTYEKIVEANAVELRNVAGLETTIEDREAEVRQFSIDLAAARTERDDKITEVKGLEGDIVGLRQELEDKEAEIEVLIEKLGVVERHISISTDLGVEELDDVMEQHMEKWTAMRDNGPASRRTKAKRESIGGMNLADEFDALSDEEYDSQDGGYDSEASSIRSVASRRAAARKNKQTLSLSEIGSVDIQPSSNKRVSKNLDRETQTSPIASPKKAEETGEETQTDTTRSPKKKSLFQVITNGVQTSPIAALIQKFTFSDTSSSGVQTNPIAASPKTVAHRSFSEILSKGISPVASSPKTASTKAFGEILSKGVQTSPVAASVDEKRPFSEVLSGGVQTSPVAAAPGALSVVISIGAETSPIAPSAEEQKPFSEVISSGVQTSPITPSPTKPTSPRKSFAEVLSNGVSTSPITPTRETTFSSAGSPTASSSSGIPLPPSPTAKSLTTAKSPLSNEITSEQLETSPPVPFTKPSKLNIKRPRVPTKDMSPATLSHYKTIAAPRPNPMLAPSTPTTTAPPDRRQNLSTLISLTLSSLYADLISEIQSYTRRDILVWSLYWISMFSATYLGSASAISAAEWKYASVNGFASEDQWVYVGKKVPGHVVKMVWGLVGWVWNLVFGEWWVGAGNRLPLSPGSWFPSG